MLFDCHLNYASTVWGQKKNKLHKSANHAAKKKNSPHYEL